MFHISAMTSLVSWSVTGHCVNLCNDLKYFYRDLGAMRSDVMAVVPVLLKSIYNDVMKGKRERLNGLRVRRSHVRPCHAPGPDGPGLLHRPDVRPYRDLR
jgi:hypothetical protein